MKDKYIIAAVLAFICSGWIETRAQQPAAQPRAQEAARGTTTITGCVYREKDVPGRAPNVAERAGVLEDYILAEVKGGGQPPAASPPSTPGPVGTSGTAQPQFGTMYKLELADDNKLSAVVGKRVEVTGRIDKEPGDSAQPPAATPQASKTDKAIGRDRVDLAEFEVVSIKEVSGACPAKAAP